MNGRERYPTIPYLAKHLTDGDEEKAQKIRDLLKGDSDPLSYKRAADYSQQCYHKPSEELLILYAADEILETFGVEGYCQQEGEPGYDVYCRNGVSYCNTGDMYQNTLYLYHGRLSVGNPFAAIGIQM
jgi:hypothetical protein